MSWILGSGPRRFIQATWDQKADKIIRLNIQHDKDTI